MLVARRMVEHHVSMLWLMVEAKVIGLTRKRLVLQKVALTKKRDKRPGI